jgi:hypothetical protein
MMEPLGPRAGKPAGGATRRLRRRPAAAAWPCRRDARPPRCPLRRVPPGSDRPATCPRSLVSGRDARAPGRDGRAPVGGEPPDAGGRRARLPSRRRPGGDRASSVSRFGWGCCNREGGVSVAWTRRGRGRARRPRSQGAVAPPRCSVRCARCSRAARHPVRNRVQDILAQYMAQHDAGRVIIHRDAAALLQRGHRRVAERLRERLRSADGGSAAAAATGRRRRDAAQRRRGEDELRHTRGMMRPKGRADRAADG